MHLNTFSSLKNAFPYWVLLFGWVSGPALKVVEEYLASVKKYPNPPASNITNTPQAGPYRGAGRPEAAYFTERIN